jgi:hypothetical protein
MGRIRLMRPQIHTGLMQHKEENAAYVAVHGLASILTFLGHLLGSEIPLLNGSMASVFA